MIITQSSEDQRIIIMACRWCLAHGNGLVPNGFTSWCVTHWSQLLPGTQITILQSIITSLTDVTSHYDEWECFLSWAISRMIPDERHDLQLALDADGRATMNRLATNCGRCGFEHHVCLCGRSP